MHVLITNGLHGDYGAREQKGGLEVSEEKIHG